MWSGRVGGLGSVWLSFQLTAGLVLDGPRCTWKCSTPRVGYRRLLVLRARAGRPAVTGRRDFGKREGRAAGKRGSSLFGQDWGPGRKLAMTWGLILRGEGRGPFGSRALLGSCVEKKETTLRRL